MLESDDNGSEYSIDNDPRQDPDNWTSGGSDDSDDDDDLSWDDTDVSGGGVVDDSGGSDSDGTDGSEYSIDNDPRQNPDNWQSDSGDASDVTGGGRVDPEDDDWAQEQQANANEGTDIEGALAEQRAAYEERMAALMENLPVPDQLGGSEGGGGLSPALGGVALLALAGGGALYVRGES
ncbi:hypothetical protein [Halorubrum sp. Boch-26]|uniref:hypothetical protein n=1 Tax=Halorubrum sp. Boch-26 TaxID=2994426 RepID=UPI0024685256|nr:hypothetical protein [Halorubrum sp. Boch-26]